MRRRRSEKAPAPLRVLMTLDTGGDVWRSQLTQAYAKQIQQSGGIGVSDQIMRKMLNLQAQSSAGA